ncbi:MAG: RnfABCDGE type electron transport complex subunit D, partial [Desulfovibrionales bacterium]|nr:RnfABCDGE type electron transport complex subunit D [Desulfovibrionales bacterium]
MNLTISGSPHVHGGNSSKNIMNGVILAMIPALLVSFYYFGLEAVRVTAIAVAACVLFEWLIQKYMIKGPVTITDGSAIVTGILLAFNLPANLSSGIIVIGALAAIGIGKMSFGGLGKNPFNPALVGRV